MNETDLGKLNFSYNIFVRGEANMGLTDKHEMWAGRTARLWSRPEARMCSSDARHVHRQDG